MTNLNLRMAAQKLSAHQFVTCCYGLLNIRENTLTFARGGHPYPIHVRGGRQASHLQSRGSLLGIFEDAQFEQKTVELKPGDKILLHSDGAEPFIGGMDQEGTFHFRREFLELLDRPVGEITRALHSTVHNKKLDAAHVDDVTVVALEVY
jgi:sigma-B regulation protein RsbU (phosphoserine phosphatase)